MAELLIIYSLLTAILCHHSVVRPVPFIDLDPFDDLKKRSVRPP